MSLLTCNWDTAKFLIFSGNIFNPLIYYSHLLPFILSFALGLFILINNRKPLISKILISIIIGFLLWLFFDLILWATEKINYIMFFWSMQVLIEPMIYAAALYFMYVFINKKDIGFRGKLIIGLLILPTILLTPTRFSLEYFDFTNCEQDVIEGVLAFYGYFIEIIFIIWILIEEGKMQFNFEEMDIVGLAKEIIGELNILATDKKLELKSEFSQEEIKIKADKQKIRQVIVNLIENSIKYTESGWVKVAITRTDTDLTRTDTDKKAVLITVSDSGIGISKDTLSHIFEEFARGKTETVKHIKGTGLGLYIAKQIIKAHNGEIWAESEGEGKGSKFYVRLAI